MKKIRRRITIELDCLFDEDYPDKERDIKKIKDSLIVWLEDNFRDPNKKITIEDLEEPKK